MAASPIAPPITPPTTSNLPAPLLLVDEAVGLAVAPVAEAVEEVAAADEELETMAWTVEGSRVPHVLQASEPGLAIRHCLKSSLQMWLGRVFRYSAMFGGEEPFAQVQV